MLVRNCAVLLYSVLHYYNGLVNINCTKVMSAENFDVAENKFILTL